MGLSRNKVAVSEGAAGSPPFYGESTLTNTMLAVKTRERCLLGSLFNFEGSFKRGVLKTNEMSFGVHEEKAKPNIAKQYITAKRYHHEVISPAEQISLPKAIYGGVAQLGEHLPCKQGVMGSNPIISTTSGRRTTRYRLIAQQVRARA